jgi:hypothetical protein
MTTPSDLFKMVSNPTKKTQDGSSIEPVLLITISKDTPEEIKTYMNANVKQGAVEIISKSISVNVSMCEDKLVPVTDEVQKYELTTG